MNAGLVYAIVVLVIIAIIGVVAAFLDRRRGRQVENDGQRVEQPEAARRNSPR